MNLAEFQKSVNAIEDKIRFLYSETNPHTDNPDYVALNMAKASLLGALTTIAYCRLSRDGLEALHQKWMERQVSAHRDRVNRSSVFMDDLEAGDVDNLDEADDPIVTLSEYDFNS